MRASTVSRRLDLPTRTVYRLVEAGSLIGFRTGGKGSTILISEQSVMRFIAERVRLFQLDNGIGGMPMDDP